MKCGKKLEKNSHFCPDCGTAVATEAPATPATPVAPAAPVAEPQPVAKPAKPKKKVNVISASLWSFFLTVAVLTIGILNVFVTELTGNAVDEILDNIELSDITLKDTKGGELTLGEFLYHSVDEEMIEKHDLSKKDFDNLLKELDWKDDAADLINDYIGYLVNGESFELEAKDLVDIIGADLYTKPGNNGCCKCDFDASLCLPGNKMVALTECGVIPDAENTIKRGAAWLWAMTWCGEFATDGKWNTEEQYKKLYSSEYALTLSDLH